MSSRRALDYAGKNNSLRNVMPQQGAGTVRRNVNTPKSQGSQQVSVGGRESGPSSRSGSRRGSAATDVTDVSHDYGKVEATGERYGHDNYDVF